MREPAASRCDDPDRTEATDPRARRQPKCRRCEILSSTRAVRRSRRAPCQAAERRLTFAAQPGRLASRNAPEIAHRSPAARRAAGLTVVAPPCARPAQCWFRARARLRPDRRRSHRRLFQRMHAEDPSIDAMDLEHWRALRSLPTARRPTRSAGHAASAAVSCPQRRRLPAVKGVPSRARNCTARDGACVATRSADCRASSNCSDIGFCRTAARSPATPTASSLTIATRTKRVCSDKEGA
jgi:hypothetical protein